MPQVVINNFPQTITNDSFNIGVNINGAKSGTNYLRVEIYKDGTTNYFGETFNGKDWYSGSDGTQYLPIEIDSASASANIQARIGKTSQYTGTGTYDLKIKRYTASGNAATDTENIVNIQINYDLATPTPVATIQTIIPTEMAVINYDPTNMPIEKVATENSGIVLAEATQIPIQTVIPATSPKNIVSNSRTQSFPIIPAILFAFGLFCIGIAIYRVYNGSNVLKRKKVS